MKKVKYDYIPPFGTDIQILEVMSKTTSNKLNKAMGKIKTVNGMFGGALANLVNTKIAGINNNNMNGNLDGTYDVLPTSNYEKQIAALKAPTTAAENHKFGKKTALEYSATVVQRHVRGMLARRFMKSQRGKTNTTNRLFNDSLVKEKDFLKWGQPKDQNCK